MEAGAGRGRGRGRGAPVVGGGSEGNERADLRRPHVPPPEMSGVPAAGLTGVPQDNTAADAQMQHAQTIHPTETKKTFTLNPDAPVFTLSAEAKEFVPRTTPSQFSANVSPQGIQNQVSASPAIPQPQMQYMNHPVILQVNKLVVQLTYKPNKFDQVARQLTTTLSWQVTDAFLMKEVITVIFEQGVGEVNFRYSGARLCQYLAKNITQSYNGPTFKSLLLQRCHEEFSVRDMYLANDASRVCGFTLFLAELFTQVVTSTSQPLDVLREGLCQLLRTLLTHPSDTNLKTVAQVLKFTGCQLDIGNRGDMDAVICQLKDVAMTAPVGQGVRSLLLGVVELRASNWGRGPPSPTSGTSPPSTQQADVPMGTVYYGPGGVIQHIEEEIEDSASETDEVNYGWSPAVEELEGDVAEAFEEFLKLQQ
ncbi:unnamed protein product [Meganyctiphanes norvegica]|uniref:MIF4G domain-containing protein n=1 Tax=Meganyctiphanes norvegica TaxID=48144 RepID=A0AAV2QQQ8_MEGNR